MCGFAQHVHSLPDALVVARLDVVHVRPVLPVDFIHLLLAEPRHLDLWAEKKNKTNKKTDVRKNDRYKLCKLTKSALQKCMWVGTLSPSSGEMWINTNIANVIRLHNLTLGPLRKSTNYTKNKQKIKIKQTPFQKKQTNKITLIKIY